MTHDEKEIEYYRAVEDLFASLRGVPHLLSPKDFHLVRTWWSEGVPLAAVRAGITDVIARRLERGASEPVVSLTFCRHAVKSHARRLADMHTGSNKDDYPDPPGKTAATIRSLGERLLTVADQQRSKRPSVATAVEDIARQVNAASDMDASDLEQHLFALESALLANCLQAIGKNTLDEIEQTARSQGVSTSATPEAGERAFRALRDRMIRELLNLPRLELES